MANAMIDLSLGSYYVHPSQGVVHLIAATPKTDQDEPTYIFEAPFFQMQTQLSLTASRVERAGLRSLATPAQLASAKAILKQQKRGLPRVTTKRQTCVEAWRQRLQYGSAEDCARILRDLNRSQGEPVRGARDKTIFVEAIDRLAAEMSVVLSLDLSDAKQEIRALLAAPRAGLAPQDEQPADPRATAPVNRSVFASNAMKGAAVYPVKGEARRAGTPHRLSPGKKAL